MTETKTAEEVVFDTIRKYYDADPDKDQKAFDQAEALIDVIQAQEQDFTLVDEFQQFIIEASKELHYAELATSPYSFIRELAKYGRCN